MLMAAKHGCDSYIKSYIYDDMREDILDFVPKIKDGLANMSYFNCFDYEGSYFRWGYTQSYDMLSKQTYIER